MTTAIAVATVASSAARSCAAVGPTTTFSYTGAEQTYHVPAGIHGIKIEAIGAPGGDVSYDGAGGIGAAITAYVPVHPGQALYVEVGGPGDGRDGQVDGGWNGGGSVTDTSNLAGDGGGASDVRTSPRNTAGSIQSRLVVAGGGGGAGSVPAPQEGPLHVQGPGSRSGRYGRDSREQEPPDQVIVAVTALK